MKRIARMGAALLVAGTGLMVGCEMPSASFVPAAASVDSTLDAASMRGAWVHRDESAGKVLVARIAPWDERTALCVLEGDLFSDGENPIMLKVWGYAEGEREYLSAGWLFFPSITGNEDNLSEEDAAEFGLARDEVLHRLEKVEHEEGTAVFYTAVIERGEDSMVVRTIGPERDKEIEVDDPQIPIDSAKLRRWVHEHAGEAGEEPYGVTLRFMRVTEDEAEEALESAG